MALSCGIIGLPIVGKTTFFNLLTNAGIETSAFYSGKTTTNMAHALVPDSRLDYLTEMFKPKKTTFAQIKIIDVPGLVAGSSQGQGSGNEFLQSIANVDALAHIVRAFKNDEVVHVEDSIDIMRDIDTINSELLFADLQLIETRLARINSGHKKKLEHPAEEQVLKKCQKHLENEQPLKSLEFTEEEQEALNHITFLTTKPMLIIINLDEEQAAAANWPQKEEILSWCAEQEIEVLPVCAKLEEEIQQLPAEERELFLSELGLTESGISRMAQALYSQLGLISFLTAGSDEVRAWPIKKGLPAKKAAGKIHSDIERGFIRAETVAFEQLKAAGSISATRDQGHFRLEGKDYIVADGDIIDFRFNI